MNKCGMLSKIMTVCEMASYLITEQFKSIIPSFINEHWIQRFINQYDIFKLKYNWKYDYIQAKCENSKLIQKWFECVQVTVVEYNILKNNIYNFDETDF